MKRKRVASVEEPSNVLKIGEPAVFQTLSPPTPFIHMLLAQMHSSHPVSFMLEHTTDAIVILDTEWHLVYANLAWERMMGLSREKVRSAGMSLWEYAPSLVGSELEIQYKKALETQQACSFTCLHPFTNKYTIVWVYPSREGVCLLMKDVTDLKLLDDMRAQRAMEIQQLNEELERRVEQRTHDLKKAQEFNARVIKDSVDGIVGFDMQYEVFAWNPTMEKATGIPKEKVLGRSLFEVFPLDTYPGTKPILERVLNGETLIFRGESSLPPEARPPELVRILSAEYERVYIPLVGDREGEIIGVVIFYKNVSVTNQVQIELSKARDEALRLAKAKSEFLANMSHELRTPLNAIIGLTDLLKDSNLDTQQHEYFDIVQGSAISLLSIVNQVLDYSKYEVGKMPLMEEDFALIDVVNSTGIAFRREADSKGLMFQWKLMDGLDDYIVNGDPGRLRQILVNLVNNAIKFTSKGFVEVILTKEKEEREKNAMCVTITVEDSGLGMSSSTLKALFTPFTQADASTTRVYGGTGLGLAIVKQIVDCMGGHITVESVEDIGTRFQLRLPFKIVGLQRSKEPPDHALSPTRHHPTCPLHPNYKQTMANLQMNKLSYDFFYGGSDMCKGVCTPPPPAEDPPKPPPAPPTPTPTFSTSSLSSSSPIISHLPSGSPITTTTVTTTTTTTTTYPPTTLYAPSASYPPVYPPNYTYTQLQYNPLLKCRRRSKSADNYYEIGGKITGTCCGGGPNCTCACRFSFSNIFPSSNNMCNSNTCNNTCNNNNNNNVNNNNNNNNNNNMMLDGFNRNDNALLLSLNNNNNTYTTTEYKRKPSTERLYSHEEAVPGRCHVLVAEDNEVNQKVLSLLLKRLQATVEVCANGQEALDKLLADPSKFDLVLMDVQMPIMDGYTAAMEIRKYPALVHIPIIAMTANAMPGDRERCLNSGMDDYIAKPINMKVLTPILQLWGKKTYIIS